jgi:trehalose/maltose hydrolase-like predicted phosphorylase
LNKGEFASTAKVDRGVGTFEAVLSNIESSHTMPDEFVALDWQMTYDEFLPKLEEQRESLCSLGNGYFCTRGAMPESEDDGVHYPGTYLAGGYNRVSFKSGDYEFEQEQLVNMPNWLSVRFKINDGDWFNINDVQLVKYELRLDLRQGLLRRTIRFIDKAGQDTTVCQRSFVHMRHAHLGGLEMTFTAHNWSGALIIRSAIDGRITNNSTQMLQDEEKKHFDYLSSTIDDDTVHLNVVTKQSRLMVSLSARNTLIKSGKIISAIENDIAEPGYVAQDMKVFVEEGASVTLEKIIALYTSRDRGISEASLSSSHAVAVAAGFDSLLSEHIESWSRLWSRFDLFVDTKESHTTSDPSFLLHLSAFHCLQTASPNTIDLDVGLPARGWSGEGYQGHVFWDALFVYPFINFRMPSISASLLKYRYRRLDSAREIAKTLGARGARFPWQSGSDGKEDTPQFDWNASKRSWSIDNSALQVHVNAAIAYDIWQYYQVTADINFMECYGAEMLLEIARFFATFAVKNEGSGRFEIRGVVGPDEFHTKYPGANAFGINNNAYTNIMAVWTLTVAQEMLLTLPADHRDQLLQKLKIEKSELLLWDSVSRLMFVPFMEDGVISQFEGYEKLEEFPVLPNGSLDTERLTQVLQTEGGTPNQYRVCKQADVLMLFYIFSASELQELFHRLGYKFECTDIEKSIQYYLPKTANDSTLSRIAHAWVLSRLNRQKSWKLLAGGDNRSGQIIPETVKQQLHSWPVLLEALNSDYLDAHHDSAREGIHLGAMAGTLDIVQRCYTGIVARQDVLWLNPRLPDALNSLSLNLHYRGQALRLKITQDQMKISAMHSTASPVQIGFEDVIYELKAGEVRVFQLHLSLPQHQFV